MKIQRRFGIVCGMAASFAMLTSLGVTANAQQTDAQQPLAQRPSAPQASQPAGQKTTIDGLIVGRDGATMSVKTGDTQKLTVVLSDSTKATETGGFLGWGRKDLGIMALVPGLPVKVEGTYDPDHKLVAQKVTFSHSSLQTARQIDAGLNPVAEEVAVAQDKELTDRKNIESAQQGVDANSKDIAQSKQDISANADAANSGLASNKQAIGEANNRFGRLDDYETKGSITVNFANGRSTVSTKDKDQLTDFVKSAANTPGFMIEVQGYASAVGSAAANQRLSAERADAVLAIIQQTGAVPMTRILAPAAMGVSDQVDDNHTRSGQAQNRRVVVTIVVNKGITG